MRHEARLAPSAAVPLPRTPLPGDPALPLAAAALLAAVLVGVALAVDVPIGIALLIALCYVPLVLVNLPLGLALWVPLSFLSGVPAVNLGGKAAGLLIMVAWVGVLRSSRDEIVSVMNRNRRLIAALAGLVAWLTLSLIWADDPSLAAADLWPPWYALAGLFVVTMTTVTTPETVRLVAFAFVAGAVMSVSIGVFDGSLNSAVDGAARLEGGTGDPNFLASSIVAAMVLAGGLMAGARSAAQRVFLVAAELVLIAGLVGSASRGGTLAAAVTVVVALVVFKGRRAQVLAGIAVLGAVAVLTFSNAPTTWERVTNFDNDNGRSDLWYVGWEMGKDNPVAGVGLNNFRVHIPEYVQTPGGVDDVGNLVDQPHFVHNTYLQLFVEGGIVALLLFLFLVAACLRAAWQAGDLFAQLGDRSLETLARAILVATISILVAAVFLSAALDMRLWLLLALGPALLAVASKKRRASGDAAHAPQAATAAWTPRLRLGDA